METLTTIVAFIVLAFGILEIVLFFKIWRMCNTVEKINLQLSQVLTNLKNSNPNKEFNASERIEPEVVNNSSIDEVGIHSQEIGRWRNSNGDVIRIVGNEEPELFLLERIKDNQWQKIATLKLIEGSIQNNGRGASFVDINDSKSELVYKIGRLGFLPSLKVEKGVIVIDKYDALSE